MQFYQEFSRYYDYIFPLSEAKLDFLQEKVGTGKRILDVAAGTGNYAQSLAEAGYQVEGIDLSEEMIKLAREKSADKDLDLNYKVADMRELPLNYEANSFDLIYCIGNSLVHLEDQTEITDVLNQFHRLLTKKGKLVIQIVNYNRILDQNVTSLPTIENEEAGVKLERNYEFGTKKVNFKTKLITPQGKFQNSVWLYPLTAEKFKVSLQEAGFSKVRLFGDFSGSAYKAQESFPLVGVADY